MRRIKPNTRFTKDEVGVTLPKDFIWKFYRHLIMSLGDGLPEASEILGIVRRRDHVAIRKFTQLWSPRCMLDNSGDVAVKTPWEFARRYQLGSFLKKFPFKGEDTFSPAMEKFYAAEKVCSLFNKENYRALERLNESTYRFSGIIDEIRQDILDLVGNDFDKSFVDLALHGPGTATGGKRYAGGCCTAYFKYAQLPYSVTPSAVPYAQEAILANPRWIGALDDWYRSNTDNRFAPIDLVDFWSKVFELTSFNRITTVPKTSETDRTIAIEPVLNVFLQLGLDRFLRKRLRKWGFDLNNQVPNQLAAHSASLDNSLATIDLKSASDTISLKICEMLLPGWLYGLLLDLRAPQGIIPAVQQDGASDIITYQKLSSMGNGYTFVIESLIFGAICRAVAKRHKVKQRSVIVYGDDIVVPSSIYHEVCELLQLCGFEVGLDKSFHDGPFRESCGKDYLMGWNVRPVMVDAEISSVKDLYYIHNAFMVLVNDASHALEGFDVEPLCSWLKTLIPKKFQIFGPVSESWDTHLFSRVLPRLVDKYGRRCHLAVIPQPIVFNRRTSFLFRKLMVSLNPREKWDESRRWRKKNRVEASRGSAFDVTKRDTVTYVVTRIPLYT